MIAIGWVTNIFQRGAASMGRLRYILTAEPGINDAGSRAGVRSWQPETEMARDTRGHKRATRIGIRPQYEGEIEFRHLTFAYPDHSQQRRRVRRCCTISTCAFPPDRRSRSWAQREAANPRSRR